MGRGAPLSWQSPDKQTGGRRGRLEWTLLAEDGDVKDKVEMGGSSRWKGPRWKESVCLYGAR